MIQQSAGRRGTARRHVAVVLGAAFCLSEPAGAVEGGVGRPITGAQILPFAGYVPPEAGLALNLSSIYYDGTIGGSRPVPVAGILGVDLDARVSLTALTAVSVWTQNTNGWNFASGLSVPVIWVEATASVSAGETVRQQRDSEFGLWDLPFTPLVAGYNFDALSHVSLSLTIFAPTGSYEVGRLANPGLNVWTFTPTVAYTKFWPEAAIELSATSGAGFYTENDDTGYENGILWNLDLLVLKRFPCGFGIGVVGGTIVQLTDDEGTLADRLGGFRGHAFGVGPLLSYSKTFGGKPLEVTARWIPEFGVEDRLKGNSFMLTAAYKF